METMRVTKEFSFEYAHKLYDPKQSKKWNHTNFGKCSNLHGHTGKLLVSIEGNINKTTGFIINFVDLKQIVKTHVIDKFDHTYLNDLPEFKNVYPTCENFLVIIHKILADKLTGYSYKLCQLRFYETPTSYATFTVEGI